MARQNNNYFEVDSSFYEQMEDVAYRLAEAERSLVIFTDGLSALEKKLMKEADDAFFAENRKRLPETLQRREARRHPNYTKMVRAKASASSDKVYLKMKADILKMKFDEWRTRSANNRHAS